MSHAFLRDEASSVEGDWSRVEWNQCVVKSDGSFELKNDPNFTCLRMIYRKDTVYCLNTHGAPILTGSNRKIVLPKKYYSLTMFITPLLFFTHLPAVVRTSTTEPRIAVVSGILTAPRTVRTTSPPKPLESCSVQSQWLKYIQWIHRA